MVRWICRQLPLRWNHFWCDVMRRIGIRDDLLDWSRSAPVFWGTDRCAGLSRCPWPKTSAIYISWHIIFIRHTILFFESCVTERRTNLGRWHSADLPSVKSRYQVKYHCDFPSLWMPSGPPTNLFVLFPFALAYTNGVAMCGFSEDHTRVWTTALTELVFTVGRFSSVISRMELVQLVTLGISGCTIYWKAFCWLVRRIARHQQPSAGCAAGLRAERR